MGSRLRGAKAGRSQRIAIFVYGAGEKRRQSDFLAFNEIEGHIITTNIEFPLTADKPATLPDNPSARNPWRMSNI